MFSSNKRSRLLFFWIEGFGVCRKRVVLDGIYRDAGSEIHCFESVSPHLAHASLMRDASP